MDVANATELDQLQNLLQSEFRTVQEPAALAKVRAEEELLGAYRGPCARCGVRVYGQHCVTVHDYLFCEHCFVCLDCQKPLTGTYFVTLPASDQKGTEAATAHSVIRDHVLSLSAAGDATAERASVPVRCADCQHTYINSAAWGSCAGCDKPFVGTDERTTIQLDPQNPGDAEVVYHPACFCCTDCHVAIQGGRYYAAPATTRAAAAAADHVLLFTPLCTACYQKTLPVCAACNTAIADAEDAAAFATVESRSYHSRCLACHSCAKTLQVSDPLYTDSSEHLFCSPQCVSVSAESVRS